MRFKKFVKLADHTYVCCNDLKSFGYEAHIKTGNGNYENMPNLYRKKLLKKLWVNLLLAGFSYSEPLCGAIAALNHPFLLLFVYLWCSIFSLFFDGKEVMFHLLLHKWNETNKTSKNDIDFLAVLILFFYSFFGEEEKRKWIMAWIVKSAPKNDVVNEKYPPPFQLAVVLVNFVEFLSCKKKVLKW